MSTAGNIIGIGEALLSENGERRVASGLAVDVAIEARRFGSVGIPVSRLGQDQQAEIILRELQRRDIDILHLQSDPDLQTGRRRVRRIAGQFSEEVAAPAAFDRLQWDFDLIDVAQQADVVFTGLLGTRSPHAASMIERFLSECPHALRMADLRPTPAGDVERSAAQRLLKHSQAIVIDDAGLRLLRMHDPDPAEVLRRACNLLFVLHLTPGEKPILATSEGIADGDAGWEASSRWTGIIAVSVALLRGLSARAALDAAVHTASFSAQHPDEALPRDLLTAVTGGRDESRSDQK